MKRSILYFVLALVLISSGGCEYFKEEPVVSRGNVPRDLPVWDEVEVVDLALDRPEVVFEKSGKVTSKVVAFVSPQMVGSVTKLNAVVGKRVKKGELLAVLGDSSSIDIADLQKSSAGAALDLTGQLIDENAALQQNQLKGASIGVETAWEGYQSALKAKREAQDVFELQVDSAELNVDRAEEAYDQANDAYDELEADISDLEDQLEGMTTDDPSRAALEMQIDGMSTQLDQLDKAISAADDGVTMAENAVSMIEEGYDSQLNQMNLGIDMALNQYQGAVNQYNSAGIGSEMQLISSDLQFLQAQSSYNAALIGADNKVITAPISGVVTEVLAKLSNLVAPGQVIIKIENPDEMSVKTAVSLDEVRFLQVGSEVKVVSGEKNAKGRIVSISPVLNEMTHKVDVEIEILDKGVFVSGEAVKIQYRVADDFAQFLPLVSLDVNGEDQFVKVVDMNGKILFKSVKMGQVFGDYVEILAGLRGNEVVVSSPSSFIEEGERVNVKSEQISR